MAAPSLRLNIPWCVWILVVVTLTTTTTTFTCRSSATVAAFGVVPSTRPVATSIFKSTTRPFPSLTFQPPTRTKGLVSTRSTSMSNNMALRRSGYDNYFAADDDDDTNDTPNDDENETSNYDNNSRIINHNNHNHYYYTMAADAGPIHPQCPLTLDQIHKVLEARRAFQSARNYNEADRLLRGLHQAGVYCHDKRREFRADGDKSFGVQVQVHQYTQRGWTPPGADLTVLAKMVAERSRAKKRQDFVKADALEVTLTREHHVQLDDKRKEWSFVLPTSSSQSYYVPSPLTNSANDDPTHDTPLDEATHALIQQRLHERMLARTAKEYAKADAIRDELLLTYNLVIDDRTREYKVVTGTSGGMEDAFVAQAQASQRSAFAKTQQQHQRGPRSRATQEEEGLIRTGASQHKKQNDDNDNDRMLDEEIRSIMKEENRVEQAHNQESLAVSAAEGSYDNDVGVMGDGDDDCDGNAFLDDIDNNDSEAAHLSTLTVVALKDRLRTAGLPVSGRKAELIERLLQP